MNKLKPCPFCGGKAEVCESGISRKMWTYGLVEHKDGCFFLADGLPTKNQHIRESDFDTWNTRAERTCQRVYYSGTESYVCSACGLGLPRGLDRYCFLNYCPNCGAKVVA